MQSTHALRIGPSCTQSTPKLHVNFGGNYTPYSQYYYTHSYTLRNYNQQEYARKFV